MSRALVETRRGKTRRGKTRRGTTRRGTTRRGGRRYNTNIFTPSKSCKQGVQGKKTYQLQSVSTGQSRMSACADVSSSAEDETRRREERTDTEVRVVSGYMILISLLFIALTLILAELERGTSSEYSVNSPVGWVSVVGAALVFGSTGIPMKSPSLKSFQVDSIVFSLYNSIGSRTRSS